MRYTTCYTCACDITDREAGSRYCLPCYYASTRTGGADRAHAAVSRAVAAGRLKKASECVCVDCGAQARCYDHRDYNKPLDVEPVCSRCNKLRGPAIPVEALRIPRPKVDQILAERASAAQANTQGA